MPKVFVGMSGGIDSSAAAYLLQKEGHSVTGVTFTALKEEGFKKCCSIEEITAARSICNSLGIEHKIVDVKDIFQTRIIKYFIDSYRAGLTPNPCVLCNRFVKFGALLEYSLSEGAEFFATGHYARLESRDGRYFIRRGADRNKDQSYFLSYIEKEKLPYILLPLGGYQKPAVREIVEKSGLPINPHKSESQDICFIKDDYREFIAFQGVKESVGDYVFKDKAIGKHRGVPFYSLGQRRGLNIAVGERIFIREMDALKNRIVLGEKPVSKEFTVRALNLFTGSLDEGEYLVQIRYQSTIGRAIVKRTGEDELTVSLESPQEIISPGQFAVFYKDDLVFAAGVIKNTILL